MGLSGTSYTVVGLDLIFTFEQQFLQKGHQPTGWVPSEGAGIPKHA